MSKEPKLDDFKYVDVWYTGQNGQSKEWERIEKMEISRWQTETAGNFNCFATVQLFATAKRVKGGGEPFMAPLYFDLDYDSDPSVSQADAVKLIDFLTEDLDLKPSDIWVYFSGSKGFHILVNSRALDLQPSNDLHKVFRHIAGYLVHRLNLRALDLVVYTAPRMLRLPNSIHQKTKLFKIELSIEELRTLTLDQIKDLASEVRRPGDRPFTSEERGKNLQVRPEATAFLKNKEAEYREAASTASERYAKDEFNFKKGSPPVCVQDIMNGGWKKEGDRNQATVQLACYYKDAGHSKEDALDILTEWVQKHTSAGSDYQIQQRIANTRSVVEAVYDKDNTYRFGCAFIRSLHGDKSGPDDKDYDKVACAGALCPCPKKNGQPTGDEVKAIPMHLSQTGDAELNGKLVRTRVMVAGKKSTPHMVPSKIEYHCWGRKSCKKTSCPLYDIPSHTHYKDLGVQDRELIQFTATGDDNVKGIIKEMSGIPNCAKYNVDVVEKINVEEMLVIPMADAETPEADGSYVLRKVYSVGKLPVAENKYYEVEGYVFAHPKNQEATLMIKNAKPLQDVVDSFKLTEDMKAKLKTLRPVNYTVEEIAAKLQSICNDLSYNVTNIVQRDETLLGALLVYHSVLRFRVPWDNDPIRGWLELKIVGDTSTGKSSIIDKLMRYLGLGIRVNAESTSRTGLTYKLEQSGGQGAWYIVWGQWPLADKEMIWIDEDTGLSKDEYGEMTLARSDGKLQVTRTVKAETPCRVRAILSGNVPGGKRLASYGQGVESLKDIFNNEDIRRFDFGIFMKSNDVAPELYNMGLDKQFPSTLPEGTLKDSILFAWSRKPEDVLFNGDALNKILELSTNLAKAYGNATDVPLVSPADQRNKVARLAVALAALTNSVDESGERIVVWPGHVEYIGAYLKAIYNAPGCGLNYHAKLAIREEELTDEKFEKLQTDLRKMDHLKGDIGYFEFVKLFARQKYLRLGDVEAMLAMDKDDAKQLVHLLVKMRMVELTSGGYRKTSRFTSYIRKCFERSMFDDLDDDY